MLTTALVLIASTNNANVPAAQIERCRRLANTDKARLACYDAIDIEEVASAVAASTPSTKCLRDRASETATGATLIAFGAPLALGAAATGVAAGIVADTTYDEEVTIGVLVGVAIGQAVASVFLIGFGRDAILHGQEPCIGDPRLGLVEPLNAVELAARWAPAP